MGRLRGKLAAKSHGKVCLPAGTGPQNDPFIPACLGAWQPVRWPLPWLRPAGENELGLGGGDKAANKGHISATFDLPRLQRAKVRNQPPLPHITLKSAPLPAPSAWGEGRGGGVVGECSSSSGAPFPSVVLRPALVPPPSVSFVRGGAGLSHRELVGLAREKHETCTPEEGAANGNGVMGSSLEPACAAEGR